jgi:DNA polymerase III epsilon subunit family exonuclease
MPPSSPPGRGPPGLVVRAAELLGDGPRATEELARQLLSLTGPRPLLHAALEALLGPDPRFQVGSDGVWSLATDAALPGPALHRLRYAVVDVETTGGTWDKGHRVTEVAIVEVEDGRVEKVFETLVNPGRPIPPRIQGLTGISDEMVAHAPGFVGVADRVLDRLAGRVFVAHNVAFDWGFIRRELLAATGDAPDPPRLCTVRLGRRLVPRLRRYNLDALTRHFGIPVHERHRAHGDALATARLLLHLLMEAESLGIADLHALEAFLGAKR